MSAPVAISMKEAAFRLGVSLSFLYDECARGRLATMKLGTRRLIHLDDFNAYVSASRKAEAA